MDIDVDYLDNLLTVEGEPASVAKAKALLFSGPPATPIEFRRILPLPDTDEDYMTVCHRTWGTYEDPLAVKTVGDEPGCLKVTFSTSSGAPESVIRELSRQVPDAEIRLDCVWMGDPQEVSASGTWRDGEGELRKVEASREHYAKVRPDVEDWELDEVFPAAGPAGI